MKKLAFIFGVSMLLTVGGVYATFNYAQKDAAIQTDNINLKLEGKTTDTVKGIIKIESNFYIEIDDYKQILTTQSKSFGSTEVSFIPSKGADQDVIDNGIKLGLRIEITADVPSLTVNGQDMFTVKNNADIGVILNNGNPIKDKINIDLNDYFQVNEISLPTELDYDSYLWNFEGVMVNFTIYEFK